jgi:hypothetical protein
MCICICAKAHLKSSAAFDPMCMAVLCRKNKLQQCSFPRCLPCCDIDTFAAMNMLYASSKARASCTPALLTSTAVVLCTTVTAPMYTSTARGLHKRDSDAQTVHMQKPLDAALPFAGWTPVPIGPSSAMYQAAACKCSCYRTSQLKPCACTQSHYNHASRHTLQLLLCCSCRVPGSATNQGSGLGHTIRYRINLNR